MTINILMKWLSANHWENKWFSIPLDLPQNLAVCDPQEKLITADAFFWADLSSPASCSASILRLSSLFLPALFSKLYTSTRKLLCRVTNQLLHMLHWETCFFIVPLLSSKSTIVDHIFLRMLLLADPWFGSFPISVDPLLVLRHSLPLMFGALKGSVSDLFSASTHS